MKNKTFFFRFSLPIVGVLLLFLNSCNKDDKLPSVTTIEVTDISYTTATSGGKITDDGGTTITKCGICWATSENPTINNFKSEDGTGSESFKSSLIGLYPYTKYYVRAYATNSNGTGYGENIIFTTQGSAFTDSRDGNIYKTVTIGNQEWMAENLRYLPSVVPSTVGSNTSSYYYVYDYNGFEVADAKASKNYSTYGVLYNWNAAMNGETSSTTNPSGVQGACPSGWHLPSDAEWTQLTDYLGGESVAGGKLKEIGTTHWTSPNTSATNEIGFTALPGGARINYGGTFTFMFIGEDGRWWSATEDDATHAWYRDMGNYGSSVNRMVYSKNAGFSVRCVKN